MDANSEWLYSWDANTIKEDQCLQKHNAAESQQTILSGPVNVSQSEIEMTYMIDIIDGSVKQDSNTFKSTKLEDGFKSEASDSSETSSCNDDEDGTDAESSADDGEGGSENSGESSNTMEEDGVSTSSESSSKSDGSDSGESGEVDEDQDVYSFQMKKSLLPNYVSNMNPLSTAMPIGKNHSEKLSPAYTKSPTPRAARNMTEDTLPSCRMATDGTSMTTLKGLRKAYCINAVKSASVHKIASVGEDEKSVSTLITSRKSHSTSDINNSSPTTAILKPFSLARCQRRENFRKFENQQAIQDDTSVTQPEGRILITDSPTEEITAPETMPENTKHSSKRRCTKLHVGASEFDAEKMTEVPPVDASGSTDASDFTTVSAISSEATTGTVQYNVRGTTYPSGHGMEPVSQGKNESEQNHDGNQSDKIELKLQLKDNEDTRQSGIQVGPNDAVIFYGFEDTLMTDETDSVTEVQNIAVKTAAEGHELEIREDMLEYKDRQSKPLKINASEDTMNDGSEIVSSPPPSSPKKARHKVRVDCVGSHSDIQISPVKSGSNYKNRHQKHEPMYEPRIENERKSLLEPRKDFPVNKINSSVGTAAKSKRKARSSSSKERHRNPSYSPKSKSYSKLGLSPTPSPNLGNNVERESQLIQKLQEMKIANRDLKQERGKLKHHVGELRQQLKDASEWSKRWRARAWTSELNTILMKKTMTKALEDEASHKEEIEVMMKEVATYRDEVLRLQSLTTQCPHWNHSDTISHPKRKTARSSGDHKKVPSTKTGTRKSMSEPLGTPVPGMNDTVKAYSKDTGSPNTTKHKIVPSNKKKTVKGTVKPFWDLWHKQRQDKKK